MRDRKERVNCMNTNGEVLVVLSPIREDNVNRPHFHQFDQTARLVRSLWSVPQFLENLRQGGYVLLTHQMLDARFREFDGG